jgi:hypothetical protein
MTAYRWGRAERLSPEQFLAASARERASWELVRIIPPVLGQPGFGSIEVVRRAAALVGELEAGR